MFADRLKEARKAKKYSQAEISRLLGVTQQAVGKWETGRSTPDPQTVARLAEILDTTADVLLGLQKTAAGQHITHSQEQLPYHQELDVPCSDAVDAKIFVIDDTTHSTMLLAEEY